MNMAVTLRYFSEFDEPAFQHITALNLLDSKAVKYVCVTKCKDISVTYF